jgi:hypothetical protein
MTCPKRARVFPPGTDIPCGPDVSCGLDDDGHDLHVGETGFTVDGEAQTVKWPDTDRRSFTGEFRPCPDIDAVTAAETGPCVLPRGHRGRCAP